MNPKDKRISIMHNIGFMFHRAWYSAKSVIFLTFIMGAVTALTSIAELLVSPAILNCLEKGLPLKSLMLTILFYSSILIILVGLNKYLQIAAFIKRVYVRNEITISINRKCCEMSYPLFKEENTRNLLARSTHSCYGNSAPGEAIWGCISSLTASVLGFVAYLLLLSNLDPVLALAVIITSLLSFAMNRYMGKWNKAHDDDFAEADKYTAYYNSISHTTEIAKDIRIFGLVPWIRELREKAETLEKIIYNKFGFMKFLCGAVDVVLSFLRNGLAYFILVKMVISHEIRASEFLLYFTAFTGFSSWIGTILDEVFRLRKMGPALSAVEEFLNLEDTFKYQGGSIPERTDSNEIRLEDVSFRYPGNDNWIIKDLNLTIHPGEKLAVVGLNGAGKTTLVKLICGFYDPTEGRVLLNGKDIREFDRREYYKLFSSVFQQFRLNDFTLRETVSLSKDHSNDERIKECLEKAGLSYMLDKYSKGLDTHLGKLVFLDGENLSGGETQRLMLARALYKDGAILILDEPTAALDPLAESDIYNRYSEMTEGKTSVFISHRLASTRFCDRILFMEHGKIKEEGTHDELVALGGGYADLFDIQARYYREGGEY